MNENQPIQIVYNHEHGKPEYINNFQIYPITSEIIIEFNQIDYKGTFRSSKNGQPTELHVEPVLTVQLQKETAMDLLYNLQRLLVPQQQPKPAEPEAPKQIEQK